jgi:diadenosine tetraphosphate (Ap4A) HIT family hydrolase
MTHALTEEQIECLRGCSQYPQYYKGRKNFEENFCPFCTPDPKINTVLYDQAGWVAWEVPQNFTTRKSTLGLQLVFFPKRHVRKTTELDDAERLGYFQVIDWAHAYFDIPGGALVNRFGDMRYNVGTIMHMHTTLMVPNRTGEVIVPLQKSPEMWTEHDARMQGFALRYEAGEVPEEFQ